MISITIIDVTNAIITIFTINIERNTQFIIIKLKNLPPKNVMEETDEVR